MNNKRLAKVLHLAADKHLSTGYKGKDKSYFSCDAVRSALLNLNMYETKEASDLFKTLTRMGVRIYSCSQFSEFQTEDNYPTEQSQGARYLWLKWAALMLEENALD